MYKKVPIDFRMQIISTSKKQTISLHLTMDTNLIPEQLFRTLNNKKQAPFLNGSICLVQFYCFILFCFWKSFGWGGMH